MDTAIYGLAFATLAFVAAIAFRTVDRRLTLASALLFATYLGLDDFATGLPGVVPLLDVFPGQWNWEGKLISILLAVAVTAALGMHREAVGLTFVQRNLKASLIVVALYLPWAVLLGFAFRPGLSAETIAFQLTMPGLAEELAYRGVAPAVLLGLVRGRRPSAGMPWAVVATSAIVFGTWHGLGYSGGSFSFELMPALLTGFGGAVACWLRFNSGSLLFPVLLHGLANAAFHLTALVPA